MIIHSKIGVDLNMSIGMNLSALPMYKEYIDNLVSFYARNSVIARRILTDDEIKYCSNYKISHEEIESLLEFLNPDQTRIIGHELLDERYGGIHATLHSISERIDIVGLELIFNGKLVPTGLMDHEGPMGDLVTRYLGYEWSGLDQSTFCIGNEIFKIVDLITSGKISIVGLQMYKNYIDDLAGFYTRNSVIARRILSEEDIKYRSSYESRAEDIESLLKSLNPEHKRTFGYLLLKERYRGIHDTLLTLGELIDNGLRFILKGEPVPTGLFGNGLADDFMKRYLGCDWLDDISQATV
jgi:phosphopantetheinyl transferase (holo-ACP synthase)